MGLIAEIRIQFAKYILANKSIIDLLLRVQIFYNFEDNFYVYKKYTT